MPDTPRVRFVVFRYGHHSPHSGYSRLPEFGVKLFDAEVIRVSKPLPRFLIRERMLWKLAAGTPGYTRAAMAAELQVAWKMAREQDSIFHFLYGETTYHYAGKLNNYHNNRLVATFHLPPVGIKQAVQIDWHLKQLSAAVVVGRSQQEYLGSIIGHERVFFAPLGVDVEYYTPPDSFESRDPNLCVIVGENYRDFPTMRGVIELVAYMRPQTQFVAVIPEKAHNLIGRHPNLTLLSGVPEDDLLRFYRSASLLVLPLKDATANNAVLEGLACGLPLVVTDVGSTRDYVDDDSAAFFPPYDARKMAETVVDLLGADADRRRMSEAARLQAEKFAWPAAVSQLKPVYDAIR